MPRGPETWTVADLEHLPDDGLRYELLDGVLLVSPAPIPLHQRAARELLFLLAAACPPSMEVFFAPVDWQPDLHTSLQPDLLVVRNEDVGPKNVTAPLMLAVEVLSPSTRRIDLLLKRSKYQDAGVTSYWVVDPEVPSIEALDLIDGTYLPVAKGSGEELVDLLHPFPLQVRPDRLVTR
jgi:Uma2 family endonuclease